MVASAKQAVMCVILDRNRLTERLVDARAEAAKLRALLAIAVAGSPAEAASLRERVDLCEAHGAYLEQQLLSSAKAVQQQLLELRKLLHELPEPIARAVERIEPSELSSRRSN
jgi:ATP/maltotriose-dependent transcriptional regulator MalT